MGDKKISETLKNWKHKWMNVSLKFAEEALRNGEVPVGCIFIYKNEIIANGVNSVNETKNATRHAEINCIDIVVNWCRRKKIDYKDVFKDVDVIVTVEPCIMCSAALFELNVKHIIYGCENYRFGGCSTVFNVSNVYANSKCTVVGGICSGEAIHLLKQFYKGTNPNAPANKVKKKTSSLMITVDE